MNTKEYDTTRIGDFALDQVEKGLNTLNFKQIQITQNKIVTIGPGNIEIKYIRPEQQLYIEKTKGAPEMLTVYYAIRG